MNNTYSQLPSVSTNLRSIMLEGGEPFALNRERGDKATQLAETTGQTEPYNKFSFALMDLLKQYQTMGTRGFEERALGLEEQQAGRIMEEATPGMPPSIQAGIRGAEAGALQPSIAGARARGQTFAEQLRGFGSGLEQARAIGSWMDTIEQREQDEAKDILFNFPQAIREMDDDQLKIFAKKTGYSPDIVKEVAERDTLSERQLEEQIRHNKALESISLQQATTAAGGLRALPATQAVMLSDANFLPGVLDDLEILIDENKSLFGPWYKLGLGGVQRIALREKTEKAEDDLKRAAQLVGKFMEGGVLRKEDEIKYAKMLPRFEDWNSDVALDKLKGVKDMLAAKHQGYLRDFQAAGFDVSGFTGINFGETTAEDPELPVRNLQTGETGYIPASEYESGRYELLDINY